MYRQTLLWLFLLLPIAVLAERHEKKKPDYQQIEKDTKDKNSKFYYPILFKKYKAIDTTLTVEEMHMLYYGYFYNRPQGSIDMGDEVDRDSIRALRQKETLSDAELKRLIGYLKKDHEARPFSLRTLMQLEEYCSEAKDPVARKYFVLVGKLLQAIFSTGDGGTMESGFHVISVPDEYDILHVLGLRFSSQSLIGHCDYLRVEPNDDNIKGIYFDVTQIFEGYQKALGPDIKNMLDKITSTKDSAKK